MKLTDIEEQVDAIRDEIYEEIKDMSSRDETAYFSAKAKEAEEKHNFRVVKSAVLDHSYSPHRVQALHEPHVARTFFQHYAFASHGQEHKTNEHEKVASCRASRKNAEATRRNTPIRQQAWFATQKRSRARVARHHKLRHENPDSAIHRTYCEQRVDFCCPANRIALHGQSHFLGIQGIC